MNASSTIRNLALVLTTLAVLGFASAAEAHKGGSAATSVAQLQLPLVMRLVLSFVLQQLLPELLQLELLLALLFELLHAQLLQLHP